MRAKNIESRGFTIVELITVMGIILIIFSLSWISLTSLPSRATLQTDTVALINDIKSQQVLAMTGDASGGGTASDYGVHFETTSYTIFKGNSFTPGALGNFTVQLENANLNFTGITFPGSIIVFTKGSGEIVGYLPAQDSVSIKDSLTGSTKTVRLNKYGATY